MFYRSITPELEGLSKQYPVVTVTGPRQSGKTTLVRSVFKDKPYVSLEDFDTQTFVKEDPRGFLKQFHNGAVFDEVQRVPELLSYIQTIVDESPQKGLFILTGSHQLELHQTIVQSLAGRTALLQLLPMSLEELSQAGFSLTLDEILLKGGYPRIFNDQLDPTKAYRNYFQTYIERDLRQIVYVKDLAQFQKFIRLCAGRIGQLINLSSLSSDTGVSVPTIKEWLSILEASFIIFRLQPYFKNFGKRLIKSPKLYFTDVGLASYLLGIENITQIARDPLRGNLVENFVILELMKARINKGLDPQLYFFRDTHDHEVDLIFQSGSSLIPIEIKSSETFNSDFLKNLHFFKDLTKSHCTNGFVIYAGQQESIIDQWSILNYRHAALALS